MRSLPYRKAAIDRANSDSPTRMTYATGLHFDGISQTTAARPPFSCAGSAHADSLHPYEGDIERLHDDDLLVDAVQAVRRRIIGQRIC